MVVVRLWTRHNSISVEAENYVQLTNSLNENNDRNLFCVTNIIVTKNYITIHEYFIAMAIGSLKNNEISAKSIISASSLDILIFVLYTIVHVAYGVSDVIQFEN